MILITGNKGQRLVYLRYIGTVTAAEIRTREAELQQVVANFKDGFRLLSDLADLDSMDEACGLELGRIMDYLKTAGIEMVVRIIPDPRKDIGLNILSVFHYGRKVRTITCKTISEGLHTLKL